MRKLFWNALVLALIVPCLTAFPETAGAQETKQPKEAAAEKQTKPVAAYRLEFVVRELENGKRVNARSYMMLVQDDTPAKVRVGSRVPYATVGPQFQYQDVGMNIDCLLRERENYVLLRSTLEWSSVVPPARSEQTGEAAMHPVFRQVSCSVSSELLPGKPTIVSVMDDVASKSRYEIEVTATRVK